MKAKVYLFSSPTCPHCPAAEKFAQEFKKERDDFDLIMLSTQSKEGQRKSQQFNVMSVPTFIIKGPGHPENIGLRGVQSSKVMNKYIDIALGNRTVDEPKAKKVFKIGKFKFKF